jgi:hypothetical protein
MFALNHTGDVRRDLTLVWVSPPSRKSRGLIAGFADIWGAEEVE